MSKAVPRQKKIGLTDYSPDSCCRQLIYHYIRDELDGDLLLEFLLHVEGCPKCRTAVFYARKAQHPEFYGTVRSDSLTVVKKSANG
jgi:hypothetical protein